MAQIEDLDHLFRTDTSGIILYEDGAALDDRIREWLETPEGTVADLPAWGNRLAYMKHEPPGIHLTIMAEMDIVEKLPRDINNLVISAIAIAFTDIDLLRIGLDYTTGNFAGEVRL